MKQSLETALHTALATLVTQGVIADPPSALQIERVKQKQHGDFACNVAMILAKQAGMPPRQLAEQICQRLPAVDVVERVEIAGPGFINFYLVSATQQAVVQTILQQRDHYGRSAAEKAKRIHLEFVSANPTGPLHVGHGRGAAHGSALANLLRAVGHDVHCEYYVNDAGRQMDILAMSVWCRYLALAGEAVALPSNGYQGEYVIDIARQLYEQEGDRFCKTTLADWNNVVADMDQTAEPELCLDARIAYAKHTLSADYALLHAFGLQSVIADIKTDLADFQVDYQMWFSEQSLMDDGALAEALQRLQAAYFLYEKNGAQWFRSTQFGDDKDRVVVRDNGQTTYFASDAAYMLNKFSRGFDEIICVFGADHHGYVPRLQALMQAFGLAVERMVVPLVQFAVLYRGGEQVQMSTRSGSFVTLRELREEVGTDAARLFYLMRRCEQHLDFDLDLAKSKSNENPVYYIQYAHARICSVFDQLAEKGYDYDAAVGLTQLELLTQPQEIDLLSQLAKYPELIQHAAAKHEPHLLVYYLKELATIFHGYYNQQVFLVDDATIRQVRLCLIDAVRQVLSNGLDLLGVSAPDRM